MGIYFSNIKSILEIKRTVNGKEEDLDNPDEESTEPNKTPEDDNTDDSEHDDPDEEPNDYSMDTDESSTEDNNEEDDTADDDNTTDDGSTAEDDSEHDDPDEGSSDYSMDTDPDEGSNEEPSDDTTVDDSSTEDNNEEDDTTDDELATIEGEIFKDLSKEQMTIKLMELKQQYFEVYTTTSNILIRANKIPKNSETMKALEFIINKLIELRDLIQFYLTNTFDTKTYIENTINYQQYLSVLNTINKLFKEINAQKENNS